VIVGVGRGGRVGLGVTVIVGVGGVMVSVGVGGVTVIVGVGGVTVIVGEGQGGVEEGVVEGVSVGVKVLVGVSTGVIVLVTVMTGVFVNAGGTGVRIGGCGVGWPMGGVKAGGFCVGAEGADVGTMRPSPGATGRGSSVMGPSLTPGVCVSFTDSVAVDVGVSVALQLPGKEGLMTPAVINTVLKRTAITSTATNGNIHPTMRENPVNGANPFLTGCCCAAAVRKAERPGRNP